jgi:Ca2+-binding RTX toxin-like protein
VPAAMDTVNGTAGDDNLRGTPFSDPIRGIGGNDTVHALAGRITSWAGRGSTGSTGIGVTTPSAAETCVTISTAVKVTTPSSATPGGLDLWGDGSDVLYGGAGRDNMGGGRRAERPGLE